MGRQLKATLGEAQEAADSVQNTADWYALLASEIHKGRQVQARADVKKLMAGDWGGIEFRLKPQEPEPDANPDNEVQG